MVINKWAHTLPSIIARKIPSFEKKMSSKEGTWEEEKGMVMEKGSMGQERGLKEKKKRGEEEG